MLPLHTLLAPLSVVPIRRVRGYIESFAGFGTEATERRACGSPFTRVRHVGLHSYGKLSGREQAIRNSRDLH